LETARCYLDAVPHAELTQLLNESLSGDVAASERAWAVVYGEVRSIATAAIGRERASAAGAAPDLEPTGLVNDIFLRIGRNPPRAWDSRRHFFGAVAQACEQVLVDLARARNAQKRGGGKAPVPLTFVAGELSKLDTARHAAEFGLPAALDALARDYPRAAEVARLRYMLGLPVSEVATVLGVSESTVEKDWVFARAWLRRELDRESGRS
jgi:RNA polymerase sigma factor (TIGR02999 family)